MKPKTVGEYVLEQPALSRVFEQYGIDYCCGGKIPLEAACQQKGVSLEEVKAAMATLNIQPGTDEPGVANMGMGELVDHIIEVHHRYLDEEMPKLSELAAKVARVHGAKEPRLVELAMVFETLRCDLEPHMRKEEAVFFPCCRQLENEEIGPDALGIPLTHPIHVLTGEHEEAGRLLARIAELTDNFTPPEWACNSYRALFDRLSRMTQDIHQHIHKENNLLFPRVLERLTES